MKTFKMIMPTSLIDVEVVGEFQARGETWVIHSKPLNSPTFGVSHRDTGFGVPLSTAATAEKSRALAEATINNASEAKWAATMANSRGKRAEAKE